MHEPLVIGAAILHHGCLLLARRTAPPCAAGRWELPGDEAYDGEDDQSVLRRVFRVEFGVALGLRVDRLLDDRRMAAWRVEDGENRPAALRVLRCSIDNGTTIDMAAGEPRPNRLAYEESLWVPLPRLGEVFPWVEEHAISAGEIARLFHHTPA